MTVGGKGAFDPQLVERQSRGERILIIALLAIGRQAIAYAMAVIRQGLHVGLSRHPVELAADRADHSLPAAATWPAISPDDCGTSPKITETLAARPVAIPLRRNATRPS
jgi:hypothetical protein